MDSNKLSISLKDYPELASEIAGSSPGDTITFKELTVTIDETGEDVLVASVEECESATVTPGPNHDDEDEVDDDEVEPVLSVMAPNYKKKK